MQIWKTKGGIQWAYWVAFRDTHCYYYIASFSILTGQFPQGRKYE